MTRTTPRDEVAASSPETPCLVVMGVSASGKTTLAEGLARRWGARFVDADDHHPVANRKKMAAGIPLDDADRAPWLEELASVLREALARGEGIVLACSALKRRYREVLRSAGAPGAVRFLHLEVPRALLEARLAARAGHFFSPQLLDSQLAALEPPSTDEAVTLQVAATDTPGSLIARADHALREADRERHTPTPAR